MQSECHTLVNENKVKRVTCTQNATLFTLIDFTEIFLRLYDRGEKSNYGLSIYLNIYLLLYSRLLKPSSFFIFLIFYTVRRAPWTEDQPVTRPLPAHRTTQTQNKSTQTIVPRVRLEPTIPVFEGAKTAHDLDRAATVIGPIMDCSYIFGVLKM
jgi:hypothetical protein